MEGVETGTQKNQYLETKKKVRRPNVKQKG